MPSNRTLKSRQTIIAAPLVALLTISAASGKASTDIDIDTAMSLVAVLSEGGKFIAQQQAWKGSGYLRPELVVAAAFNKIDPQTRQERMLVIMQDSIKKVMDQKQKIINERGKGVQGFVPVVFAREVIEQFQQDIAGEADLKMTAPDELLREKIAAPDEFEKNVIEEKFRSPDWPKGKFYAEDTKVNGRLALRVLVPQYYGSECLSCHGEPKGKKDITHYPMEGGKEGDLGGVFSVTLFR